MYVAFKTATHNFKHTTKKQAISGRKKLTRKLDELDLRILKSLTEDSRKSTTQIAKEAQTTRPTAIARINRLEEEKIIDFGPKIRATNIGLKFATLHFESQEGQSTEEIVNMLSKCPRIVQLIQLTGKPTYTDLILIDNAETLLSTIDCMSSTLKIKVNAYQRVLPLIGDSFNVKIDLEKKESTPCGKDCQLCLAYQQNECVGCPSSTKYKGQI